jgi:hypothetical protein
MKFKNIPNEILESDVFSELMGWNLLSILIEEFPESVTKDKILKLIVERQKELMESEV